MNIDNIRIALVWHLYESHSVSFQVIVLRLNTSTVVCLFPQLIVFLALTNVDDVHDLYLFISGAIMLLFWFVSFTVPESYIYIHLIDIFRRYQQ
jgi:hypothetical protein